MKVPEKYYDEIFSFKGQWDMPSACGLKIIEKQGKTTVIVTELYQDNPGTSVASAGRSLAEQICKARNLDFDKITYLECNPATDSKLSFYGEEYFEVNFNGGPRPVYRLLSPEEAGELFGR
ncbi:MAG: hypothetical protein LBG57_08105 [Treponema sp.]|jgi:hypothetical protein|nr:hypothetical protein [Treponema sp.]